MTGFVVSHNLHRRHLTDAQRAIIGARMTALLPGSNQFGVKVSPIGETSGKSMTRADVLNLMDVSKGSLSRAKNITTKGIPEVVEMGLHRVIGRRNVLNGRFVVIGDLAGIDVDGSSDLSVVGGFSVGAVS